MTTVVRPVTKNHINRLIDSNRQQGDSNKQAVFNVLRYFSTIGISPHEIKIFLDTKAASKVRREYEYGEFTATPDEFERRIIDQTMDIRTVHRKLAELVKEGLAENKKGLYSLTLEAESDIRYFAYEFGHQSLHTLMGAFFPTYNTVQQNLLRLVYVFGILTLYCFIEIARPMEKNSKGYPSTNTHKEHLVSLCLQNMIPIEEMYNYFLTVAENQSYSSVYTAVNKELVNPLDEMIIAEYQRVIKDRKSEKTVNSAIELYKRRLLHIQKSLRDSNYEAFEKDKSWYELDKTSIIPLSQIFKKTFPSIYNELDKMISNIKSPKQVSITERESWPELF